VRWDDSEADPQGPTGLGGVKARRAGPSESGATVAHDAGLEEGFLLRCSGRGVAEALRIQGPPHPHPRAGRAPPSDPGTEPVRVKGLVVCSDKSVAAT
jgi:hypothetical protein